jgi:chromosome segregation ATPase
MNDTLSIRVDDATRAKFEELMETSGLKNRGELLNAVLTQYALQETRERVPSLSMAVSAVNELSERICKVLVGAGEAIVTNQERMAAEHEERTGALQAENVRLVNQVEALRTLQADQSREHYNEAQKAKVQIDGLIEELARAREAIADKSALLDQYKATIALQQQQLADNDTKEMQEQLEQAQNRILELSKALESSAIDKDRALLDLEQRLFAEYKSNVAAMMAGRE